MEYRSTRGGPPVQVEQAIMSGTAADGGLYVPCALPVLTVADFAGCDSFAEVAARFLQPFLAASSLEGPLAAICREALDFPIPVRPVESGLSVLELFHGPTAAFKDVGARFLAAAMSRILHDGRHAQPPVTILVATSGDTGGAVAAAFHGRPGLQVVVLFPEGRVSPRQQHQLTCWGGNVTSLAVRGEFDDCQRLVKAAFADPALAWSHRLCSANSINVGRLLPQMVYYARASLELARRDGRAPNFIIPTGNLGNALACIWAREAGLPIGEIVLASNANLTVPDFLQSGEWRPRPSVATLASAMDVGNPSNMERLRWLFPSVDQLRGKVSAVPVSDDEIRATIRRDHRELRQTWCPHTATAAHVYAQLADGRRDERWVLVATAHPAKFNDIVEPLIGEAVPVPPALAALLELPSAQTQVEPNLEALRAVLTEAA